MSEYAFKLEKFRSGGFINRDYDIGRIYVDMPINDARKAMELLKELRYTEADLQREKLEMGQDLIHAIDCLSEYNLCEGTAILKDDVVKLLKQRIKAE